MAQLLPADFDLRQLRDSEQRVVRALLDGLDDDFVVVPQVLMSDRGHDAEIDVVVASPTRGAVAVEVKGGRISLRAGTWYQYDTPMKRSPIAQVTEAKHVLLKRLRSAQVDTRLVFLAHAVALPDAGVLPDGGLGPEAPREVLWGAGDLADPAAAIDRLLHHRAPPPAEQYHRFLRALRPDIVLQGAATALMPHATRRIDTETATRLEALHALDQVGRVLVTGGAGSGKTWLVVEWARRAAARGERTVVLTFNRPLADHLERLLEDTRVTVATYHDLVRQLLEPHGFTIPDHTDRQYWEHVPTAALIEHLDQVGTPFDTVIIDEGQDMRPHWLDSIERLIDPAGPRRLLMVADPAQAIYVGPWSPPAGMTPVPLTVNLRSGRTVAAVVQQLGGPPPLPHAAGTMPVRHLRAGGTKEVRKRVRSVIDELTGEHGVPLSQIAVLTLRTDVRDALLDRDADAAHPNGPLPLAGWEERSEDTALCMTVHRGKGLERAAVIVVDITDEPERQLVYIGASRAMWSLTLVGTDQLADVAGVPPQPRTPTTAEADTGGR